MSTISSAPFTTKILDVKLRKVRSPLVVDPYINYEAGAYLDIEFEIQKFAGFRLHRSCKGTYSYKLVARNEKKPLCALTREDLEKIAERVIHEEFGGQHGQ